MGLISRVSSRTYRYSPWDDDQHDATAIVRTSLTPNLDSTEVSQTLKSEFSISVTSEPTSWPSQSTSLWYPTSPNSPVPRHSNQQDVVVRRRRSSANRYARSVR